MAPSSESSYRSVVRGKAARAAGVICLLIPAVIGLVHRFTDRQTPPTTWTTGFWFWDGSSVAMGGGIGSVDVIYCQAGSLRAIGSSWKAWATWPRELPPAREYWIVLRSETLAAPPETFALTVVQTVMSAVGEGRRRGAHVAGVQFDVDCPTGTLAQYAKFLAAVRKELPADMQISITALLDWFRPGTAVGDAVRPVDEFVPQFYDVGDRRGAPVIAARIDEARWGPVFNRYGRRFRIGVSSFGRCRFASRRRPWFEAEGISPIDLGVHPSFKLSTSTTEAGEIVLKYTTSRNARISYWTFEPGETIEFTAPTQDGMRTAIEQAKKMAGWCAGVVFFRWPSFNETLTALPGDALAAAGVGASRGPVQVQAVDGGCAAVHCADLILVNARPLSPVQTRYRIRSSTELEYVVPRERMPFRMTGSTEMELTLPPYSGRSRMYLGRAVTREAAEFKLEIE